MDMSEMEKNNKYFVERIIFRKKLNFRFLYIIENNFF